VDEITKEEVMILFIGSVIGFIIIMILVILDRREIERKQIILERENNILQAQLEAERRNRKRENLQVDVEI
jgi:uncharacterized membrane protein YgaE (UPF0421/DUF939 family)